VPLTDAIVPIKCHAPRQAHKVGVVKDALQVHRINGVSSAIVKAGKLANARAVVLYLGQSIDNSQHSIINVGSLPLIIETQGSRLQQYWYRQDPHRLDSGS